MLLFPFPVFWFPGFPGQSMPFNWNGKRLKQILANACSEGNKCINQQCINLLCQGFGVLKVTSKVPMSSMPIFKLSEIGNDILFLLKWLLCQT